MNAPRFVVLSTGAKVPLDGDLLAVIESLSREVTLRNALNASFDAMRREILGVIDQLTDAEKREYMCESVFLNTVTYENEKIAAYVRNLSAPSARVASRKSSAPAPRKARGAAQRPSAARKPARKARARS